NPPETAWERVKGLARLNDGEQVAAAMALAAWRERTAARQNRPRQWILRDEGLLAIAAARPGDVAALRGVPGLPPGLVQRRGAEMLDAIARGGESPALRRFAPPTPEEKLCLERLAQGTRERAAELGLEPQVLATRAELVQVVRGEVPPRLAGGWRA